MYKTALILMATYNGERFLSKQLDSIIEQTFQNWRLLIRDDGSSDSTLQILEKYSDADSRITVLQNKTNNHGAYLNFWTLIHEARKEYGDFDFYFFSDQDDIWAPEKIDTMVKNAEMEDDDKPLLLYADMRVINQDNEIIYDSLNETMGIGEMRGYSLLFTHGFLWGCDICVNKALFVSFPLLPLNHPLIDIMSHDNYLGKYALLTGSIKYVSKALISHRRHQENTTGGYDMALSLRSVIKKVIFHLDDLAKTHARVYDQTLVAIELIRKERLLPYIDIESVEKAIWKGGFPLVKIMNSLKVRRKQITRCVGVYCVAFLGKYKKYLRTRFTY